MEARKAPAITPLLIRFGRLGDMVLQTPLLHLLHQRFGAPCDLLTSGHWSGELFAGSPDIAQMLELDARHAPLILSPQRWRLLARLREHRGPVYVSENIPRQEQKIRRLLDLARIDPAHCVFLSDQPAGSMHWVDRLLRFGERTPSAWRAGDYPVDPDALWMAPRLQPLPADRAECREWLRGRGLDGRELVLLQPGNKRAIKWGRPRSEDNKAWPVANWVGLARAIRTAMPSCCVVLCGSPAERPLLEQIRRALADASVVVAADDLPVRRLLSLLALAHSMVAVDTGPAHMAAAVGCRLVVLYGAESPQLWARRSPSGTPTIELGGPPQRRSVSAIALSEVIDAWKAVAAERIA